MTLTALDMVDAAVDQRLRPGAGACARDYDGTEPSGARKSVPTFVVIGKIASPIDRHGLCSRIAAGDVGRADSVVPLDGSSGPKSCIEILLGGNGSLLVLAFDAVRTQLKYVPLQHLVDLLFEPNGITSRSLVVPRDAI